jgi:glycosyltransferase involved in cell wall biosynthesis
MHILTLTSLYPNAQQPLHALFVRTRMERFARRYGHRLTVVAPVPYFPRLFFPSLAEYDRFARVPAFEDDRGYPVHHPRYLLTPKVGMRWHGASMAAGVTRLVRRIHSRAPIDVIDGHYVYPDGTAAVAAGRDLGVPVVLSSRGTDLNLFPRFPAIRRRIQANLAACRHLVCVCTELKNVALELGAPEDRVSVIGNAVDATLFHGGDRDLARAQLGLPASGIVILSVGHMTERKGFHLLIGAVAGLRRDDVLLCIAGDGPQRSELVRLVAQRGLVERVRFPGAVRNEDLPAWYRAADLFVLASSREGWPNVLCEAQACGLPVVATRVWGIPEIVSRPELGVLVEDRSEDGLSAAISHALGREWDRAAIEAVGRARTWERVADELEGIFRAVTSRR